jgi:hypothetical protein
MVLYGKVEINQKETILSEVPAGCGNFIYFS